MMRKSCLFDGTCERDMIVWSVMIAGYSRLENVDKAKDVFCDGVVEGGGGGISWWWC
ncbi:PPR domain protein [Medicago truncatula]|uniref:PPR domain protein n=1 Tax=Medicago truncatula TaxID=3880 RepID=G7J5N9_MEDTR|nr:PPR domain protein [Medicago truncatula]